MKHLRSLLISVALTLPISGQAQQVVATDGSSVANFFLGEGFEPTVETDNVGDPLVKVDYYGIEFSVFFYGCTDGADCKAIQFYKGYQTDGSIRLNKMNEWNTDNRYARAYNSSEGSARIEHDVYLGNTGLTADDFAALVGRWTRAVREFEEFIDW